MTFSLFLTETEKAIIKEYGDKLDLTSLNESDKKDLLYFLNNLKLELRRSINVSKSITFGVEIEFDKVLLYLMRSKIMYYQEKKKKKCTHSTELFSFWDIKSDDTVTVGYRAVAVGGEVISPIMKNCVKDWQYLKEICNLMKAEGASISDVCAGHIHFGKILFWMLIL